MFARIWSWRGPSVRAWLTLGALGLVMLFVATASAQAVTITTTPSLYPGFDTSIPDYVVRCDGNTPVAVTVNAEAGTTVDVDGQGPQSGTFTTSVDLATGQEFSIVVTSVDGSSSYYVRCLPSDFPNWTFQRSSQPQAEFYAVQPFARTDFQAVTGVSNKYGAIFDANGVPVWWLKTARNGSLDFKLLPNGDIGWAHGDGLFEDIRLDGSVAHALQPPATTALDSHEMLLLPNGDYLVAAGRPVFNQTACGVSNAKIGDAGIEEMAPDGSVVWSWWASEHIALSEVPAAWCPNIVSTAGSGGLDTYHINSIEPDGDGYVVSFRHLDAVYRIKRSDGSIDWKLGGVQRPESLTVVNDPIFDSGDGLRGQHDARVNSDGTVSIHDNGYHPNATNRPPRAVRFAIDTSARTATLVQEVDDPGTVATPLCCGSARMLPGGDWVMNWGSAGLTTELDSSGARVDSLAFSDSTNGTMFSYRAQPILPGTISRTVLRDGMSHQFPRTYIRPRGASPLRVALVPAYASCATPNSSHGAPLSYPSCEPPGQTSGFLTVGTPDANGAGPNAIGLVRFTATSSDALISVRTSDVRCQSATATVCGSANTAGGPDYAGQLQATESVRITDKLNGPNGTTSATVQDTSFPVTVPCTATPSISTGSTCSISTSADAVIPGSVQAGKRAIWALGPVQVFDGGASGVAGAADATLFEDQGLFIP